MSTQRAYTWQALDSLWGVASRFLEDSGFPDTPTLAAAIASANNVDRAHYPGQPPAAWQAIYDWNDPALAGRVVAIPYAT